MKRRLFHGQLSDEIAGEDRPRAQRLRQLARELIAIVREGLIREGQVRIHGFGTFHLRPTRAHKGINPQTGETIQIPARNRVLFRPAKALRERVEPSGATAVPLAEPHASREAVLGGVMGDAPAAGALPAGGTATRRHYFPDRIAAASMAGSVARAAGPGPALGSPVSGSREANLGGAMADTPSAGRVPLGERNGDAEVPRPVESEPAAGAANEADATSGAPSREAALGASARVESPAAGALPADDLPPDAQEPDRPGTVPRTLEGPAPVVSAPEEAGVELDAGASREAGLTGRAGGGQAAGGLPPEPDERADRDDGFDADAPLREDSPGGPPTLSPPEPAGLRESALADGAAAGRPAGGLPDEAPPWDAEPDDRAGRGTRPATREGPTRPASEVAETAPESPEGSREAVLGGPGARAAAAGALPDEPRPDAHSSQDWVAPAGAGRTDRAAIDDDVEAGRVPPPGETEAREERRDSRGPLLVLLLLLIAALLWWFWPRAEEPAAPVADSGVTTERTDTVVTDDAGDAGAAGSATESAATAAPDEDAATTAGAGAAATAGTTETAETTETTETAETADSTETADTAGTGESAAATDTAASSAGAETAEAATERASATSGQPATGTGDESAADAVADAVIAEEAGVEPAGTTTAQVAPETTAETAQPATTGPAAEASTPWFDGRSYSVRPGDTLWDLSDAHYVNPYYWPHIWNHNGELANPDRIEIDQVLWLPTLEGEPRSLTAADRRSIAEGYLRLYRLWRDTGAANPQYALVGVRYFDPSVLPPELKNDPAAGRPTDALAAAFAALLEAEFPHRQ
ncbi:MAG: HU family DNA-binding protein [Halofilum sp. (in: g-proteobacteria)]|nr:HU family DNA-binding protein [Halofilum sp. (in: g-proteobacteria)]